MRAVRCHSADGPSALRVDELPDPAPGVSEILVDVKAAGVNFPDLLLTKGQYQFKPPFPFVPGGEAAGIVSAVGPGVASFRVGDRVAFSTIHGAFAEKVVVPEAAATFVPASVLFETAAATLLAYSTTMYALVDRADLKAGETLLVLGAAGGVGIAAVEIGKALGAKVIAATSSADKTAFCRSRGADLGIDYGKDDLKAKAKDLCPAGVDVVYDPVGGDLSEAALRSIGWGGRFLVIGFASGAIPKIPLNLALLKGCQIVGVFWGSFAMREPDKVRGHGKTLFRWIEEGKIAPHVDAVYPFSHAAEALERMGRREVRGKLVLVPG